MNEKLIEIKTSVVQGQKLIRIQDVVNILDNYACDSPKKTKKLLKEINDGFKILLSS